MAYQSLVDVHLLLRTIDATNEVDASDDLQSQGDLITSEPSFQETLTKLLDMMRSKLEGPQTLSFSSMTEEDLFNLNITFRGSLKLKTDYQIRVDATKELGWSSEGLYRHLCVLQKLVPKVSEAASRAWIESFFFRASVMMPQGMQLVLTPKQSIPLTPVNPRSSTTLGGFIDYTAIRIATSEAATYLGLSRRQVLQNFHHMLFVSEAKTSNLTVEDHVPQAVCVMYAGAKQLGRNVICGAVTDGRNWIFLVLKMNSNGDGAIYAQSSQRTQLMNVIPPSTEEISRTMCDVIAGIIGYWIEHSNEDIGDDDWFSVNWSSGNKFNRLQVEGLDVEGETTIWVRIDSWQGTESVRHAMKA